MRRPTLALLVLAAACARPSPSADEPAAPTATLTVAPTKTEAPAGPYRLDKSHASLDFKVDHIGFSSYVGRFKAFDATLAFNPQDPAAMRVEASIDVLSLDVPTPPEGFLAELLGPTWLDAGAHPTMTFRSTAVTLIGPDAARVVGDLAFRGVVAPIALIVRFNGGYKDFAPYDPNPRIGFSATGTLSRSAYGLSFGLPPEGSRMGVGDAVSVMIEAEFTGAASTPQEEDPTP